MLSHNTNKRRWFVGGMATLGLSAVVAALVLTVIFYHPGRVYGSGSGGGGCFATSGPACAFTGHNAYSDFESISQDGCTYTDAGTSIFDNFTNPGKTSTQSVQVYIYIFNQCTGQVVESASNFDPSTYTSDFTGTLTFSRDLSSASVNGTAPLYDNFSGALLGNATIALTWKGYGPTFTFSNTNHYRGAGFLWNSHSTGSNRSAEVAGSLIDQTGTNYAAAPSLNGDLSNSQGGTVQLSRS